MNVGASHILRWRPTAWIQAGWHTRSRGPGRMNVERPYVFCVEGQLRGIQVGWTRAAPQPMHECWSVLLFFALEGRLRGIQAG
jgi:hypothetical protein